MDVFHESSSDAKTKSPLPDVQNVYVSTWQLSTTEGMCPHYRRWSQQIILGVGTW